jgi:hypothetical protein
LGHYRRLDDVLRIVRRSSDRQRDGREAGGGKKYTVQVQRLEVNLSVDRYKREMANLPHCERKRPLQLAASISRQLRLALWLRRFILAEPNCKILSTFTHVPFSSRFDESLKLLWIAPFRFPYSLRVYFCHRSTSN